MGTILRFESSAGNAPASTGTDNGGPCEVVIFPGVRIERHEGFDLSHRVCDSAGRGVFDGIGDGGRPRKTS